jgi:FHS family L-fucose permease-like MFS transporter
MAGALPIPNTTSSEASDGTSYRAALTALATLFFMFGFLTCLNDIIIPRLKAIFELSYTQAMMVQFAFFTAYFVVSPSAGRIVQRVGYKRGIVLGLGVAAAGCLLFYPAASVRSYPLFLAALLVLASGITTLQVAANPFVAVLGPAATASSRLSLTQGFNSLGTTLAPLFGAQWILSSGTAETSSVQRPYLGLALALLLMAAGVALFKLPEIRAGNAARASSNIRRSAWSFPHLTLGAVGIFAYVGAEVAIGSFLISFLKEPSIAGLTEAEAARYVSFYWGGAMMGRFAGTVTLRTFAPRKVLTVHALACALLVVATMLVSGHAALWTILAVGLFNSVMFPTIFTLAIDGLGEHTGQGSGILCMAIVGGAIVPLVQGLVADRVGIHHSFVVPVLCYGYIAWYAVTYRRRNEERLPVPGPARTSGL